MKIALFFGSFNPIHIGHLIIAQTALNETNLEKVWLVVSPQNPFKSKNSLLREYDRLRMAELAIGDHPGMEASNVEFSLPKPSYTIDTLEHLRKQYPSYQFAILMGEDNLQHFHKWKRYEEVLKHHPIYCYPRLGGDGTAFERYPEVTRFELPYLDLSATRIRKMIAEKKSVRYVVPDDTIAYIEKFGLYGA